MKTPALLLAAAVWTMFCTSDAAAQVRRHVRPPIGKYQPYTSPALGMLSPGGPTFGYLTTTEPQEQFRQNDYNFRRDISDFERQVDQNFRKVDGSMTTNPKIRSSIGATGHGTSFQSYGSYFPAAGARR